MDIITLWCLRNGEDTPELLVAWDEYSYEQNPDGYWREAEAAEDGIRKYEPRTEFRQITLEVPYQGVNSPFNSSKVGAKVKEER